MPYYGWGSGSYTDSSDQYFPLTPEDSPRTTNTTLGYGSGSDYSGHSGHSHGSSSRSSKSKGKIYVSVNGQPIADINSSTGATVSSSHRSRRRSVVVHDNAPKIHHRRGGSHSSHGSAAPPTPEPETIYIEKNVGDDRPARRLIIDNPSRRSHRNSNGDINIEVRPTPGHRRSRRDHSPSPVQRVMSWSDDEEAAASRSRARSRTRSSSCSRSRSRSKSRPAVPRKSSIKRHAPTQRKKVEFDTEDEIIEPHAAAMDQISLANAEIKARPPVPDPLPAYIRPRIRATTYNVEQLERERMHVEQSLDTEALERLRRRQERPPVVRRDNAMKRPRRNSLIIPAVTAPPMGIYNPLSTSPMSGHRSHAPY